MSNDALTILSTTNCGATGRVVTALYEKQLDFEFELITNEYKRTSAEFLQINPMRLTPVLLHGDRRIFESSVICEYLDDKFPEVPLLPRDPGEKAIHRAWICYVDTHISKLFQGLFDAEMQPREGADDQLFDALLLTQEKFQALSGDGPYWSGSKLGLVDICHSGLFYALEHLKEKNLLELPERLATIGTWAQATINAPSMVAARQALASR